MDQRQTPTPVSQPPLGHLAPQNVSWEETASSETAPQDVAVAAAMAARDARLIELRRLKIMNDEYVAAMELLNECYAIVTLGDSDRVVAEFSEDRILYWSFEQFKKRLIKSWVRVPPAPGSKDTAGKPKRLADAWIDSAHGREYNRAVCGMPGRPEIGFNDLNLWRGFAVQPKPGDWSRNYEHLRDIICGGDDEALAWVLNWCAALVQRPGQLGHTALVLNGREGTGKGHFVVEALGGLFRSEQFLQLTDPEQLTGDFNGHLSNRALVFADESAWGGDKRAVNKLKGLITERQIMIHRKFMTPSPEPNSLHVIIASNERLPVLLSGDDRRYTVLHVSDARMQDGTYFKQLCAELRSGGLEAMLHDLQQYTVDWDLLRQPHVTEAKRRIKELSMPFVQQWMRTYFDELTDEQFPNGIIEKDAIYRAYVDAFKQAKPTRETMLHKVTFGQEFADMFRRGWTKTDEGGKGVPCEWPKEAKTPLTRGKERKPAYRLPSLGMCRWLFALATGTRPEWADGNFAIIDPGMSVSSKQEGTV
jgi:hypothetical protein